MMWRSLAFASIFMLYGAQRSFAQSFACDEADQGINTLGTCEGCEGQFFMNFDCSEAFYCSENVSAGNEGCKISCDKDEILVPNFGKQGWSCVNETETVCPGRFHIECNQVTPAADQCECEAQLLINGDCTQGFYCRSRLPNGGQSISCDPEKGEIIAVDFDSYKWGYESNMTDKCPGLGGFKLGCYGDFPTPPPPIPNCEAFGKNRLGSCRCDDQLFISDNCNEGFLCINGIDQEAHPGAEGCIIKCPEGKIIQFDFDAATYSCVDSNDYTCPGHFNMDCASDDVQIKCSCPGEFWMKKGCKEGFYCYEEMGDNNSNLGKIVQCSDKQVIQIEDLADPIKSWSCTNELRKCPDREEVGGFTFGCGTVDDGNNAGKLGSNSFIPLGLLAIVWLK